MFFIIKGDVSVTTKDGETSYASLNAGNFFGGTAGISGK
jgi:hypothetical protein